MKVQAAFDVEKWEESPLDEYPTDSPVARVSVVYAATGAIEGRFQVEYVMHYTLLDRENPHLSAATYCGYMLFDGEIDGKSGGFVLEENGSYADGTPTSDLSIMPDTGTGDFAGISGGGRYFADDGRMMMELIYSV